jgi:membrane-bound lytic murein transglycosylase D
MAAYNAGPVRVQQAIIRAGSRDFWTIADKSLLPKETMNYVPTVLAMTIIGNNPEKYGFSIAPDPPIRMERVSVSAAFDLRVIAETINVPVDQLRELNPHLLRWTTPPNDPEFQLIVPEGSASNFSEAMAAIPGDRRVLWAHHTVGRGDTLSTIAKKYGTTVADLTQANGIDARKTIQVGQSLLIPIAGAIPPGSAVAAGANPVTAPIRVAAKISNYMVRSGDTLSKIAGRFGVTVSDIQRWNKMSSTVLAVGRSLAVSDPGGAAAAPTQNARAATPVKEEPRKVVHKVRSGETLNRIAQNYKTTVESIRSLNGRADLSVIHPGDQITIFMNR